MNNSHTGKPRKWDAFCFFAASPQKNKKNTHSPITHAFSRSENSRVHQTAIFSSELLNKQF